MIDISNIQKYKENNRIEAKKALGGLPKSIWETYSAFANTLGGVILLGVEEYADKTFHPVNLPNPEKMVEEFWDIINTPDKVNVNILSDQNVIIHDIDGNRIIAITVPRAQRYDRPIYIDKNPLTGTYRRNGEGDYRCTPEEVQAMLRDAAIRTQDMTVLENMEPDVFDYDSIQRYRMRVMEHRPGHVWEALEDIDFLYKLGAVGRSRDGTLHPTAAGLLMFGREREIVKVYPNFSLHYQERKVSHNLYDFYFGVSNQLMQDVEATLPSEESQPEVSPKAVSLQEASMQQAVRNVLQEALANCLVNADYYGEEGISISKNQNLITMSNPGGFRIDVNAAKSGGISDPRNAALTKMFHLINIGEGTGGGIRDIYQIWKKQGWKEPVITEEFDPERTTLTLMLGEIGANKAARKVAVRKTVVRKAAVKKTAVKKALIKKAADKAEIVEYLTRNVSATSSELAALLEMKPSHVKVLLEELVQEDIIVVEGSKRNRVCRLKA